MNIRRLSILVLLPLFTTACNEYYVQDDRGYDRGYDRGHSQVSDYQLINTCKDRVISRVERRLGSNTKVHFDYSDVDDLSSRKVVVSGDANTKNYRDRLDIRYRCEMDRYSGQVNAVDVRGLDRPNADHGNSQRDAVNACKQRIRHKVQRDTRADVSLAFKKQETERISKKRIRVTGHAKVKAKKSTGKISYQCDVRSRHSEVESARYQWTKRLNAGIANKPSRPTKPGFDGAKRCHNAIKVKLHNAGFIKPNFRSTQKKMLNKNLQRVSGNVRIYKSRNSRNAFYDCRINTRNGNVTRAVYKMLDTGSTL